jgi:hypothetical protein
MLALYRKIGRDRFHILSSCVLVVPFSFLGLIVRYPDQSLLWVIALTMEAASTSETTVNLYQTTQHNIPQDSNLHTHRREDLKSRKVYRDFLSPSGHIIMRKYLK